MGPRGAYLAVAARPGQLAHAQAMADRLDGEPAWRRTASAAGWRVWTTSPAPGVHRLAGDRGLLVGEAFPGLGARDEDPLLRPRPPGPAAELARGVSRARWGRYVALLEGLDGAGVYRDPSGGIDVFHWDIAEGVCVVASELERVPAWLRPRWCALDWDRIGLYLARPSSATSAPLFEGLGTVGPGDLRMIWGPGAPEAIWTPAAFAGREIPGEEAATELLRRVDLCTDAIARGHDRLLVELSGGLDSSIVAGALGATGHGRQVAAWLNWNGGFGEGDERAYARAVTERLGVELTEVDMIPGRLDPADLAELASSPWPAMNGVDAERDRDETRRLEAAGATGILSGQGGDAVFFQMPSPAVLADAWRRQGLRCLSGDLLPELARRRRGTVWQVLRGALQGDGDGAGNPLMTEELRRAATGVRHAWVGAAEAAGLPPGKRLQIEAIANCHLHHGYSRRRRCADLLYPLLAQPVVELCLAIPTPDLAGRAQDRAYARQVFATRLPEAVRFRRAKGAYNGYAGRLVANSTELLKPFLLEGCLVEAGLLDHAAVEAALDPVAIMQGAQPTWVMWAACVEAWVRHWQTRLPDSLSAPRRLR